MPLKTIQDEMPSLNMTPMIDIVFLLLIFFMVGTRFSEMERNLDLQIPQVADVKGLTEAPVSKPINVYRDGKIGFEQQTVNADELTILLRKAREQYADLGVLVRGDEDAPYLYVARVYKACHDAGINDLGISLQLGAAGK